MVAVDVDDYKFNGELEHDLVNRFNDYRFICYSTASSTVNLPKFRLVFPLTETVRNGDIKAFWYALQTELGDLGDKQTKGFVTNVLHPWKTMLVLTTLFSVITLVSLLIQIG